MSVLPCSDLLTSIHDTAADLISPTAQHRRAAAPDWKTCLVMLAEAKRPLMAALQVLL
jgi:hypothetical protein